MQYPLCFTFLLSVYKVNNPLCFTPYPFALRTRTRTRTRTPEGGKEGDKEGGKEGGKEGVKESEAKNTTKEEIAPYTEGKEYEPSNSTLGNSQTKTRSLLKEQGYLRRDSRIKERRKYGLKKARKAEQYSKR